MTISIRPLPMSRDRKMPSKMPPSAERLEEEIFAELDSLNLKPDPELARRRHRRYFALGLMACASFVLLLSFVFPETDRAWWIGGGLMILAAGAYQLDRTRRDGHFR